MASIQNFLSPPKAAEGFSHDPLNQSYCLKPLKNIVHNIAVRRIAVTGPESSGKTTLCRALSRYFHTVWTPEYARFYLQGLGRPYVFSDLKAIGKGQLQWQQRDTGRAQGMLFCDTDLIALKVWSDYRFGDTDPWILERLPHNPYDLTLLCHPDIPWEADPLRENPHDRGDLLHKFRQELGDWKIPFFEVRGTDPRERLAMALEVL